MPEATLIWVSKAQVPAAFQMRHTLLLLVACLVSHIGTCRLDPACPSQVLEAPLPLHVLGRLAPSGR